MPIDYGPHDPRTLLVPLVPVEVPGCYACSAPLNGSDFRVSVDDLGMICDSWTDRKVSTVAVCTACSVAWMEDGEEGVLASIRLREYAREIVRHRGVDYFRVMSDRVYHGNTAEVVFAEEWAHANGEMRVLDRLVRLPCNPGDPGVSDALSGVGGFDAPTRCALEGGVTDRDRAVAATVIQWLGTNVGRSWLGEALEKAGYEMRFVRSVRRDG